MGKKVFRIVFALWLAFSAVGFSASTVLAAPPVNGEFPITVQYEVNDLCPFHVDLETTFQIKWTVFFDGDGYPTKEIDQLTGIDTLSANGKTLVGLPYTFSMFFILDKSGNWQIYTAGEITKIPVPGEKLFTGGGRLGPIADPTIYSFTPTHGRQLDPTFICAALAP